MRYLDRAKLIATEAQLSPARQCTFFHPEEVEFLLFHLPSAQECTT
jgi:hypothetical protein